MINLCTKEGSVRVVYAHLVYIGLFFCEVQLVQALTFYFV